MGYGSVTVTSDTAVTIIAANHKRHSYLITIMSGTNIYFGDSSVTTATGFLLRTGSSLTEDSGGEKLFGGSIYAIADKLATVRYWEREH